MNLDELEERFADLDFEAIDDTDVLRIVLYYFADGELNERKYHCQINILLLNKVDEIDHFRNRQWGRLSWKTIYNSIDNALNEKAKSLRRPARKIPAIILKNTMFMALRMRFKCMEKFFSIT